MPGINVAGREQERQHSPTENATALPEQNGYAQLSGLIAKASSAIYLCAFLLMSGQLGRHYEW
jgi:hypothetical protein